MTLYDILKSNKYTLLRTQLGNSIILDNCEIVREKVNMFKVVGFKKFPPIFINLSTIVLIN